MARGRMISTCLSASRKFASLQQTAGKLAEFAQSLYPLVVVHCDDFGRMAGDGWSVKFQTHPTSPRTVEDFDASLNAMERSGLITRYDDGNGGKCLSIIDFESHQTGLHKRTDSKFPEPPGDSGKFREIPREEKRREEKRTEEKGREGKADAEPLAVLWNTLTTPPIPRCTKITPVRAGHIKVRRKEHTDEEWADVFTRIEASSFCRGQNDREWVASFDWAMATQDAAVKVLEGKYDNHGCDPKAAAVRDTWIGVYAAERNGAAYPDTKADHPTWTVLARTYPDLDHLRAMMRFFLRASDLPEWAITRSPNAFLRLAPETDAAVRGQ